MICNLDTDVLKVALQAPAKLQMSMPTEASYPIVWDSGASVYVSNDAADFQGTLTMTNASPIQVKGVSQGVTVSRQGMVLWYLWITLRCYVQFEIWPCTSLRPMCEYSAHPVFSKSTKENRSFNNPVA